MTEQWEDDGGLIPDPADIEPYMLFPLLDAGVKVEKTELRYVVQAKSDITDGWVVVKNNLTAEQASATIILCRDMFPERIYRVIPTDWEALDDNA